MSELVTDTMKDQVKRCALRWEPDEYLWLSPGDRDEWLEVSTRTFIDAEREPAEVAESLRRTLGSRDCPCGERHDHGHTFPLRATYRWLKLQGAQHDGAVFDLVG